MKLARSFLVALSLATALVALPARATFHTFVINEIFSNADGSIQYVVLHESLGMNGQSTLTGHALTAVQGMGMPNNYAFPIDLPGGSCDSYYGCMPANTANKFVLIATTGFAALHIVTPDYIIPNGFLPLTNGTINYAGVDQVSYASLPTDGVTAISRAGMAMPNLATNFAGATGSVSAAAAAVNYQGLWWASPAASESGWGINFAHQADTIFASWFTYDAGGKGLWLVMTAPKTAPNTYAGTLYSTTGPAFNAVPFNPAGVVPTAVGNGTITFTDANDGSFAYTVNGIKQVKADHPRGVRHSAHLRYGHRQPRCRDQLHRSVVGRPGRLGIRLGHQPQPRRHHHLRHLVHLRAQRHADVAGGHRAADRARRVRRHALSDHGAGVQCGAVQSDQRGGHRGGHCDLHLQRRQQRHLRLHRQRRLANEGHHPRDLRGHRDRVSVVSES